MDVRSVVWAAALSAALFGCGPGGGLPGGDGGGAPPAVPEHDGGSAESLWPLGTGSTWTYRIADDPLRPPYEKTVTVEGMAQVPGTSASAVKVRSVKPHLEELSYQVVSEGVVFRVREEDRAQGQLLRVMSWNPSVMKALADPQVAGWTRSATVVESERDGTNTLVDEKEKIFAWTVEAVDQQVVTPAGTFTNAIKLRRERADKDWQRVYWLVPGVGKVREEGEHTEELLRYTIQ